LSRRCIGKYVVIGVIARGGSAEVFEVRCPTTHQNFALKMLNIRGSTTHRFEREFQILKALKHPNIVRVFEQGIADDGRHFITMERLHGTVAHTQIRGSGPPGSPRRTSESARVVSATAEALTALHARGVIHRDIKAANILILSDASVRLLDFGSASADGMREGITNPGEFVGTFAYAAPEQILGEPVSGRIDVYALGVMFYRLVTGKMPFSADNQYRLAQQHLQAHPRTPQEICPGIPASISDLIMEMLRKDPSTRPTASAVHSRLTHGEPGAAQTCLETIQQRISSLRPITRRLMQALVVAGEPISDETLGHMTDIPPEEARHRLQRLESDAWVNQLKDQWFIDDQSVEELLVRGLGEARRYLLQTRLHEFRRLITDTVC